MTGEKAMLTLRSIRKTAEFERKMAEVEATMAHRKPGKMTGGFRHRPGWFGAQVLEVQVYSANGGTEWVRASKRQAEHVALMQRVVLGR
jgi:hypothetical protein